jgi:hypothetical protein
VFVVPPEDVEASEAAEVLLVNSLAPFVLNSKLVPLMATTAAASTRGCYVVNVSAMEVAWIGHADCTNC